MIERQISLRRPLSLRQTYGVLRNGNFDPCVTFDTSGFWRSSRTPEGPVTTLLQSTSATSVRIYMWGRGAAWFDEHVMDFLGEHQDDLPIEDKRVAQMAQTCMGMRIPRVRALVELMVPIILGQRVTTREAFSAYRRITHALSETAPGPNPTVLLPPDPQRLRAMPSWWFHRYGVERKRAEAIRAVCSLAATIDRLVDLTTDKARKQLLTLPGVGLWTAGIIGLYGLGDHDSVILGDFHIPNHVAWALAGEARGNDQRMLELLEPFRGQRGRILRVVTASHPRDPKFGPRYNPLPVATY